MIDPFTALMATAAFTLAALAASFGVWHRSVRSHLGELSDPGQFTLKFVVPTFLLLTAGSVVYVTVMFAGRAFPTAGLGTMTAGIAGSFLAAGYVLLDVRLTVGESPATRKDFEDAAT